MMTTNTSHIQKGLVKTEGDTLYYEVRGHGQPLLMIPGGGGDGRVYSFVADILSDEYKVITYDRRGNARSTRNVPQNFEISQQSRDAVAVLHDAGESSAFVFGNSSGAVIALDMAITQPQAVRAAVVHEPPITYLHPQARKWQRFFAGVYGTAFSLGAPVAMVRFFIGVGLPLGRSPRAEAVHGHPNATDEVDVHFQEMAEFFIKKELLPVTNYVPNEETLRKNGVKVFTAAGKESLDKKRFYAQTAPMLAQTTGCEMIVFPGHHISYIDRPEAWASVLRSVLQKANG